MSSNKTNQLGMSPSTASNRLVKDLLYSFVASTGKNICYQCSLPMSREDFSIEHKTPWLNSNSPLELYFDLSNISFSHLICNIKASRKRPEAVCGTTSKYEKGCRCQACREAKSIYTREHYSRKSRQERYKLTGH